MARARSSLPRPDGACAEGGRKEEESKIAAECVCVWDSLTVPLLLEVTEEGRRGGRATPAGRAEARAEVTRDAGLGWACGRHFRFRPKRQGEERRGEGERVAGLPPVSARLPGGGHGGEGWASRGLLWGPGGRGRGGGSPRASSPPWKRRSGGRVSCWAPPGPNLPRGERSPPAGKGPGRQWPAPGTKGGDPEAQP